MNEMIINLHVFRSFMKHQILNDMQSTLIQNSGTT